MEMGKKVLKWGSSYYPEGCHPPVNLLRAAHNICCDVRIASKTLIAPF